MAGPGRDGFWRFRRSRPLPASLPMTDAERRTMTAGWFLGQIIGRIQIPAPPYTEPVRIYDGDSGPVAELPEPAADPAVGVHGHYDWLPAVLESILLAIAQSHEPPVMRSLRPYRVLRELFDAHSQDPASGIVELSAVHCCVSSSRTGSTAPGVASRLTTIAAAATPAERTPLPPRMAGQRSRHRRPVPARRDAGCGAGRRVHDDPHPLHGVQDPDLPRPGARRVLGHRNPDQDAASRSRRSAHDDGGARCRRSTVGA